MIHLPEKARLRAWLTSAGKWADSMLSRFKIPSPRSSDSSTPQPSLPERLLREFVLRGRVDETTDGSAPAASSGGVRDARTLSRLAWLEGKSGRVESAILLYSQLMQSARDIESPLRREAGREMFRLAMRECTRLRSCVSEKLAMGDEQGALDACGRQIELSAALLRTLDHVTDAVYWTAAAVTYNYAVASEAFGLWSCGRGAIAEEVIAAESARHVIPESALPRTSESDRREMTAELVSEHGWVLFAQGKWREAGSAFQFARTRGYEAIEGPCNRNAVELLAREAICAFNDRNYARAYEMFTAVICRFPGEDIRGIRILREKAHQAKLLGDSVRLYEKAANAFQSEDWVSSAVRYRDAADFLEYREHPELRELAAECYYNASMALCNSRRYQDARRILRYVLRAYPDHEPSKVAERLRQLDRMLGDPGDAHEEDDATVHALIASLETTAT